MQPLNGARWCKCKYAKGEQSSFQTGGVVERITTESAVIWGNGAAWGLQHVTVQDSVPGEYFWAVPQAHGTAWDADWCGGLRLGWRLCPCA